MDQPPDQLLPIDQFCSDFAGSVLAFTQRYTNLVVLRILDNQWYSEQPQRFYYTILHKVNNTLHGCVYFIANFHRMPLYRTSVFILLRSILTDLIAAEYVYRIPRTDVDRNHVIDQINADHVRYLYNDIERRATIFRSSQQEKKDLQENLRIEYPQYFTENGKLNQAFQCKSTRSMIMEFISHHHIQHHRQRMQGLYFHYDTLSKFEHPGMFSFQITHRAYESQNLQEDYRTLFECVLLSTEMLFVLAEQWEPLPKQETDELLALFNQICVFDYNRLPKE
jgi:hypothetical protein